MRPLLLFVALAAAGALPTCVHAAEPATKADVVRYADTLLAANYSDTSPGVSILIARGDEVLYRGTRGLADIKTARPLKPGDVFQIGSISKQFTAAALLTLVESGKVALSDPLAKYVPAYPGGELITVLELLNHTSGVKDYTTIPGFMAAPLDKDLSTAQLIATFKDQKPDFAPGSDWAYDNSGYVLVGAIIEAASGMPWHEYERKALFAPLGLTHTGYGGDPELASAQVRGYAHEGSKVMPAKVISMTVPHAAGALLSTVDDLMKWNRALHEGRVLKSAAYAQMITPVGKAAEHEYGFGIEHEKVRGQDALGHSGGIFGFATMLDYVPGPDISVVVLQNSEDNEGHDAPEIIARKLTAAALGQPYPLPVAVAVDAAALKGIEGVYQIDDKSTRVLRVADGALTAQRTGNTRHKLVPIGRDEFLYDDGLNRFTVERDAKGAVTGMRFFAEGEGPGVIVVRSTATLPADRQEVPLQQAQIDRLLGNYTSEGPGMKIFLDGKHLMAQLTGQPPVEIFAETPSVFFMTAVDATLDFGTGPGPAATAALQQGDDKLVLSRAR